MREEKQNDTTTTATEHYSTVLYCTLLLYCLPHSMVHLHIESRENPWCGFSISVDLDLVLVRTYDSRIEAKKHSTTSTLICKINKQTYL